MREILSFCAIFLLSPAEAFSQTSVALYGTIDTGLTYINNTGGNSSVGAAGGILYGSKWGLTGTEDLGAGSSAIFKLESGFSPYSGKSSEGGQLFGKQAYLGLTSREAGTLTLGRQYDSMSDFVGPFSSYGTGYSAHFADLDNLYQNVRLDNAVKYVSPQLGPITFGAVYSFGNQPESSAKNRSFAVGLSYARGPWAGAIGYLNINDPATRPDGTGGVYAPNGVYESIAGAYRGLQNAENLSVISAGIGYDFGSAVLNFVYSNSTLKNSKYFVSNAFPDATPSNFRLQSYEINTRIAVTPAVQLIAAYNFNAARADYSSLKPIFHQINLTGEYFLSKRTILFLSSSAQLAARDGLAPDIVGTSVVGSRRIASIVGTGDSSTRHQLLTTVGLHHNF